MVGDSVTVLESNDSVCNGLAYMQAVVLLHALSLEDVCLNWLRTPSLILYIKR